MFETLMKNPYAWFALSLCTIISLIFAVYTWIVGRKIKEISVDYITTNIIKNGTTDISKLEIKFAGKTINELYSSVIYIWNSGSDVINITDIVTQGIIKILCESECILDVFVFRQSDESNAFSVKSFSPTDMEIIFEYLDAGEGVALQILHTNLISDWIISCKIKGGKKIRNCHIRNTKGMQKVLKYLVNEIIPMAIMIISMGVSSLLLKILKLENELFMIVGTIIFAVIIVILYYWIKIGINRVFHRNIPINLKENTK